MEKLIYTDISSFPIFVKFVHSKHVEKLSLVQDYGQDWDNQKNLKHWYWLFVKFYCRQQYAVEGGVSCSGNGCKSCETIYVTMFNIGEIKQKLLGLTTSYMKMLFLLCVSVGDIREQCKCFETNDICDDCMNDLTGCAPSYAQTDAYGKPNSIEEQFASINTE